MKSLIPQLVEQKIINQDQLRIVKIEQQKTKETVEQVLIKLGFVTKEQVQEVLGEVNGYKTQSLQDFNFNPTVLSLISEDFARRYRVIPLALANNILEVGCSEPDNLILMDRVKQHVNSAIKIQPVLVAEEELDFALDCCFGADLTIDEVLNELAASKNDNQIAEPSLETSQPIVRLVDKILQDAIKNRASDIHLEPEEFYLRVRYRIDGVLQSKLLLHKDLLAGLIVRIKVMAGLDLTEQRLPQDGRLSIKFFGNQVDFRVASMPTINGETLILRVLDRSKNLVNLSDLCVNLEVEKNLRKIITKPSGIFLVTGPTGSGKTTTLYSLLQELNHPGIKISTLEDPVEYPMAWLQQTSINEELGIGFAQGIRAVLRQDPDILLIGEIRDAQTAEMAFRASMTGHQVFATLHTNSAIGALARLQDLGVPAGVLADNINGVVAQRLVRKLCNYCKKPAESHTDFRLVSATRSGCGQQQAVGCDKCQYIGYSGRIAVQEVLYFEQSLNQLLLQNSSSLELLKQAKNLGFKSLAQNVLELIEQGITSWQEASRVIDMSEVN